MLARTSFRRSALLSALTLTFALGSFHIANAQDASSPVRAARLTSSQGIVTVADGNNPAVPAQMNVPLPAGVQIATGEDGQAEIEFEDGSIARLTPNSTLSLDRLDVAPGDLFVTDLSLLRGLAYFELRATPEYAYSINAGGDMLSPVENTTVRVDFDEPPASFAVLEGSAEVQRTNSFQSEVHAGQTLRDDGNSPAQYSLSEQIAAESWDQWNADMDQQASQQSGDSTSVRDNYAGAQGYGWGDLDADGTWYNVPGTGPVWQPYSAEDDSGFDPYGNGAWVWYPGTGYTWASAYPWGWTPYRCGAWSYYNSFGWGWAPGATCGGFGWGFAGGGFAVNITVGPRGYRPVRVPVARPGPVRPILPVRITTTQRSPVRPVGGPTGERHPRQIAGVTAQPIAPVHSGFGAQGANAGGSLHRDFPIDRTTHTPAMGAASTRPTNVYRVGQQSTNPQQNGQQQQPSFQGQRRGPQPTTTPQNLPAQHSTQPTYARPQQDAPQQSNAPAQNTQPTFARPQQNAPQQSNPPAQNTQPTFARPQQNAPQQSNPPAQNTQPTYARPQQQNAPQQQQQHTAPEHPAYTPPQNSQPQQQRYTPQQSSQPQQQQRQYTPQPQPQAQPQHTEPAHPNFTPQQSSQPQQRNFSPPPSSPPPAPHYSAPPPAPHYSAPAPAPHYSAPAPAAAPAPPPSPPPPAPHVNAPPPSTNNMPSHK